MAILVTDMELVSENISGTSGSGRSIRPIFSPDGSKIAFESDAPDLAAGDNGSDVPNIFVRDLATGATIRVSENFSGEYPDNISHSPVFSPDSSKVAFHSNSSNLVSTDTNNADDIFIKDLATGAITLVSTNSAGVQGDGSSETVVFSPDGSKIAFVSSASNLVSGDNNGQPDIFVKDLTTGVVTRIASGNALSLVFSPDGTKIAYEIKGAGVSNDILIKDLTAGTSSLIAKGNGVSFSPDGSQIVFSSVESNLIGLNGDTNGAWNSPSAGIDVFVKNLETGTVARISTDSSGHQVDSHTIAGAGFDITPFFSPDGSKIVFAMTSTTLVPEVYDPTLQVYIKDITTGEVALISKGLSGEPGSDYSFGPRFSPDGTQIVFASMAPNLVDFPTGEDVFLVTTNIKAGIYGTGLADTLNGTSEDDIMYGHQGADTVHGKSGNDFIRGGAGDDLLYGGSGNDHLFGDVGNDNLYGNSGVDTLSGGIGNDRLEGGADNDMLDGDDGDDLIYGGSGDDILSGGTGADYLSGYNGHDVLNGGAGIDKLYGGADADTFVFDANAFLARDTVKDFTVAQGDKLEFHNILEGFDPLHSQITDFIKISDNGINSYVSVDRDGAANGRVWTQIARLDGVTGLTNEAQLLADHVLLVSNTTVI